jgi:cholesterol transport system auxiliary component
LDTTATPRKAAHRSDRVLLIALPQVQPGFDTQRIAYTKVPLSLDYYTKSEWADTPARMLTPLIVHTLESTGGFRAVVAAPTPVPADLRLDIDIIRFQQEFLEQPSRLRITLRAQLIDVTSLRVLSTQLFEAVEIAPSENAYGGVQAANIALGRLLGELADFVLATMPVANGKA